MKWITATSLLCLLIGTTQRKDEWRLLPVDEAKTDARFLAFRTKFIEAVHQMDNAAVQGMATPGLVDWEPNLNMWRIMDKTLALGGSFTTTRGLVRGRREFCAPYVYSAFPFYLGDEVADPTYMHIILGNQVPVHASASGNARIRGYLSYDLVDAVFDSPRPAWIEVLRRSDRMHGFVEGNQVRSPLDYSACFADVGGQWKLVEYGQREPVK